MCAGVPDTPLVRRNNKSIVFCSLKTNFLILKKRKRRSSSSVFFFQHTCGKCPKADQKKSRPEKKQTRKNPYLDTFHAVTAIIKKFPRFPRKTTITEFLLNITAELVCNVSKKQLHCRCSKRNIEQDLSE